MLQQLTSLQEKQEKDLKKVKRSFNNFGYLKLALILLLLYFIFETIRYNKSLIIGVVITFILLVIVWIKHLSLEQETIYLEKMMEINERYLKRIKGEWHDITDDGSEYIQENHPYCTDLDILGPNSLYQLLNISNTYYGQKSFVGDLLTVNYSKEEILERQSAVLELSNKVDFKQTLECETSYIGNKKSSNITLNIKTIPSMIIYLLSAFLVVTMLWYSLNPTQISSIVAFIVFTIMVVLFGYSLIIYQKQINDHILEPQKLNRYYRLIKVIEKEDFQAPLLQELQSELTNSLEATKQLNIILQMYQIRTNPFIYAILGVVLLWDYHLVRKLQIWYKKHGDDIERWYQAIGTLESLSSLSNLAHFSKETCLPVIEDSHILKGEELAHPLLPNQTRVANDINFNDEIGIISGSNMSGKTTFIRTIGINIILSNAGGLVCGKSFTTNIYHVISSMRIKDDLNQGLSTFYTELKRVKDILELAKTNINTCFLIDEIFKGTNSYDRLEGARQVIKSLDSLGVIGFITTHDLELGTLETTSKRIKNYSFSESYSHDMIVFDYKLKVGISTTTNASFLMKQLGII